MSRSVGLTTLDDHLKSISKTPPRNLSELPGLKYKLTSMSAVAIFPLIVVVFFIFMSTSMDFDSLDRKKFENRISTEGRVLSTREWTSGEKEIKYVFETERNETFYGTASVYVNSPYTPVKEGDSIPIVYEASQPAINDLAGNKENLRKEIRFLRFFPYAMPMFILLIFGSIFAAIYYPTYGEIRRVRKIFLRGLIAEGEIIFVKQEPLSLSGHPARARIFYKYKTTKGLMVESKNVTDNEWIVNRLDIGSRVTIAYMEDKPQHSFILECFIR